MIKIANYYSTYPEGPKTVNNPSVEKAIEKYTILKEQQIELTRLMEKPKQIIIDFFLKTGACRFSVKGVALLWLNYGSRTVTDLELLKRNLRAEGVNEKIITKAFEDITTKKQNKKPALYVSI